MPISSTRRRPMHNRLRELRTAHGLSRRDLAERIGVNVQTVGSLERGQYAPSVYLALVIAEQFEVRIDDIFWLESASD